MRLRLPLLASTVALALSSPALAEGPVPSLDLRQFHPPTHPVPEGSHAREDDTLCSVQHSGAIGDGDLVP